MARTIFGIFSLWLSEKQKIDATVGREISTDLNGEELTILANQYGVSKMIEKVCQKAIKLNNKERVFLFNSVCLPQDMVFENTDHNKAVCRGDKAVQVAIESAEIGLYSVSDDFFWNDKDFGFMSFNELRANELSFAIQDWFSVEK